MGKPVILAVDDDVSVLEMVVQDLRRQYGANYRIQRAASGQAALDTCDQLKKRGDVVALFVSDQRMPGMSGVEFLGKAMEFYPDAKRALLTAYADTEAAIQAINTAKINYYLTKPWDPPEERLYPVLNDLLETWKEGYKAPFEGLRVVGPRYTLRDHQVRDFLSRNRVPYVWLDPEQSAEGVDLLTRFKLDDHKLPVVLFGDGSYLVQPGQMELAGKIGLRTQAAKEFYDLVIIGAGLAGLAAAVYGASEGLRTLVIEDEAPGGQAGSSSRIENYLGFPEGVSGQHLAERALIQATRFGAEMLTQKATGDPHREQLQHRAIGRWPGSFVPRLPDRCGRLLPAPEHSGSGAPDRGGGLLRGGDDRSQGLQRRECLHRRGGELGRPGSHVLLQVRKKGNHAGKGGLAEKQHVEIFNRSDCRYIEYRGQDAMPGGGSLG